MDGAMGALSSVFVAYDVRKLAIQDLDISRLIYSILPTINQSLFPIKSCVVSCPGQTDWGVFCQVNFQPIYQCQSLEKMKKKDWMTS